MEIMFHNPRIPINPAGNQFPRLKESKVQSLFTAISIHSFISSTFPIPSFRWFSISPPFPALASHHTIVSDMSLVPAHEPPSARCLSNTASPFPGTFQPFQRCRMIRYKHLHIALKNPEGHTNIPVKSVTLGAFMHIQSSIDPCVFERGDEKEWCRPHTESAGARLTCFHYFLICLEGCDGMKMQERASLRWEALRWEWWVHLETMTAR